MTFQVDEASLATLSKPTMEIRLNGLTLDMGELTMTWPNALRQVAKVVAATALERAVEFGERNSATIEIWDKDGRLLLAVSANVQASWPGWRA